MKRKTVSGIILTLLLISMLTLGFNIQKTDAEGTYKVTAVAISASPDVQVGIKSGDWIKYNYTVTGAPETPAAKRMKVEFLSVEGTNATVRVTIYMADGTEQNETKTVDVMTGGGTFGSLSGFVIPANSVVGGPIYISGYGNITLVGEATRTHAEEDRTVVYASFSNASARYYWDKQTGIMVEASVSSDSITVTARITETSLWGYVPFWTQWWFWAIVTAGIVILVGVVYMKRRKPPTTPTLSPEGTNAIRVTYE